MKILTERDALYLPSYNSHMLGKLIICYHDSSEDYIQEAWLQLACLWVMGEIEIEFEYRRASFYCAPLYCAPQMLHILQIVGKTLCQQKDNDSLY